MKITEITTEVFEPGKKNWEWARLGHNEVSALFKVGGREYLWQAFTPRSNPKKWEIQFRLIRKPDVDPDDLDLFGATGTGNSAEVMSTAVDITRAFLKDYGLDKVEEITFLAKEDSRIGLYAKMIKRLLPNWDLHKKYDPEDGMQFTLTDRRAYDKPENKLGEEQLSNPAQEWIKKVYSQYPQTWQNNHVMPLGDEQFAMFELVPSMSKRGAVEVKWFQAYPLRQGLGSRAMQELQRLAREDGIALTLFPWDKGQVSQAKLIKFYKGQGFKPAIKGSKNLTWEPKELDEEHGVWEEINPETIKPGFEKEKWIMGKYLMRATYIENSIDPSIKGMLIKVYDPETKSAFLRSNGIATTRFLVRGGKHMESAFTSVASEYQRQGISSAMYQFARELGNDIKPSKAQSKDAKAFWAAGAGVGKDFPHHERDATPIPVVIPKKQSWFDRVLGRKQAAEEQSVRSNKTLTEAGLQFYDEVPNEEWLQDAINYVKKQPKDQFGKPRMLEVTGRFNRPVVGSIGRLAGIPGARGEQSNVREGDLQAIMKIMRETGKLPLDRSGREYIPLIGVDYTGKPWVLEGNHRIMAAWNLYTKEHIDKWDRMPVEIRYFDGGERADGPLNPNRIRK